MRAKRIVRKDADVCLKKLDNEWTTLEGIPDPTPEKEMLESKIDIGEMENTDIESCILDDGSSTMQITDWSNTIVNIQGMDIGRIFEVDFENFELVIRKYVLAKYYPNFMLKLFNIKEEDKVDIKITHIIKDGSINKAKKVIYTFTNCNYYEESVKWILINGHEVPIQTLRFFFNGVDIQEETIN